MDNSDSNANDNLALLTWKRQEPGRYCADFEGRQYEIVSLACHTEGASSDRAWHVFDHDPANRFMSDDYCTTVGTAWEAKDCAELILRDRRAGRIKGCEWIGE